MSDQGKLLGDAPPSYYHQPPPPQQPGAPVYMNNTPGYPPQQQAPPADYYNHHQQQPPQYPPHQQYPPQQPYYDPNAGAPISQAPADPNAPPAQPAWVPQPHPPINLYYHYPPTPQYPTSDTYNADNNTAAQIVEEQPIEAPPCQDKCCAITFILNIIAFFVCVGITYSYETIKDTSQKLTWDTTQITLFTFSVIVSIVLSFGVLMFIRNNAKCMIWSLLIINALSFLVLAVIGIGILAVGGPESEHLLGLAITLIVIGVLFALVYLIYPCCMRKRIAFAATLIKYAVPALTKYNGVFIAAFGNLILTLIASSIAIGGLTHMMSWYNGADQTALDNGPSEDIGVLLIIVIAFSFYWIGEFLRNSIHTIVSGIVGSYFYLPTQTFATFPSVKRAWGTSFGSIAFASGLLTAIRAGRFAARVAANTAWSNRRRNGGSGGNNNGAAIIAIIIIVVILACLACLLSCFEKWLQWFNSYGLVRCALYGESYVTAAKGTWDLFLRRGWTMMINDDISSFVLGSGAFFSAAFSILLSAIFWWASKTDRVYSDEYINITTSIIVFVPLYISLIILGTVTSAVRTLFVVWAEDPDCISQNHPNCYNEIEDARKGTWI